MQRKKMVKKILKIKWRAIVKLIGFLFFVFLLLFFLLQIPTKRIIITGNQILSDNDIIVSAGFKDYPKLFQVSNKTITNRLLKNPYINQVHIHKSIFGTLSLDIDESHALFYNRNNNKLVLSNAKEIDSTNLQGAPTLVNYVPDTYYSRLTTELGNIQFNVLALVSEIEYNPWKSNEVMIDETRFLLRMSDGNLVYINLINMNKLNDYINIYATLEDKKGTLFLDSSGDKISFRSF